MKFTSRKDLLFSIICVGICLFLFGIALIGIFNEEMDGSERWILIPIILVLFLLLWLFFDTGYELDPMYFSYRSGPFKGKIKIESIKEIVQGKTLWVGLKPATARNGLIIKYNTYYEIYISPKTNETFVKNILELNNKIKITKV